MKRDIEKNLIAWKTSETHSPIILKGARQVGKSYSVRKFGEENFKNCVVVDFEKHSALLGIYNDDLAPKPALEKIQLYFKTRIIPGETLLFFDEVQRCPRTITALRYFKEEMPELHVIAAGSLLDFAFGEISVPVGRVTFLHMHPLSFYEFLDATENNLMRNGLQNGNLLKDPSPSVHSMCLARLKEYTMVGGMPAAVQEYINTESMQKVSQIHSDLLESFRQDFSKYATRVPYDRMLSVMERIPKLIGQQTKYTHIDRNISSRDAKQALLLLERAQILRRVRSASGQGIPLGAYASDKTFKTLFLDIGLMHTLCGLHNYETFVEQDIGMINDGSVAEQLVGQELLANSSPEQEQHLYYWKRDARNSEAEVDYLLQSNMSIVPVEVKSGKTRHLTSLRVYQELYHPAKTVIISSQPYKEDGNTLWLPLYAIGRVVL